MCQQAQGSSAHQSFNDSAQHFQINTCVSPKTMTCRKFDLDYPLMGALT
jgi:hypothetical protein